MESPEELQQQELTALRSIYGDDFIETPPPKAWKGAVRLPEFEIRVQHPSSAKIAFNLNVKFPKTYPILAYPTFTIQKPTPTFHHDQVTKLSHALHSEAQSLKGNEMVFQIVAFCQEWLNTHVSPPIEVVGSLALQMSQRAEYEERLRQQKAREEEEQELERANKRARELEEQFEADAIRQMIMASKKSQRKRANSETTEVPLPGGDIPTETFEDGFTINGVHYDTVKYFHPRNYCLGVLYAADVLTDDAKVSLPLELYVVTFESHYYTTSQGRKKLTQLETELQRLTAIHHTNVLDLLAVKLVKPNSGTPPQLMVLTEQPPPLTLQDVLEDSECLREDRAVDYMCQILSGLNIIHSADLVHRGINPRAIALTSREQPNPSKLIKLQKAGFHVRLLDLHKSNPFANHLSSCEEPQLPEAWLSRDVKYNSTLVYTRQRDIHDVGIVFLQMLMGLDVVDRFSDVTSVFDASSISSQVQGVIFSMMHPKHRKASTCTSLLTELMNMSPISAPSKSPVIAIPDLRTPMQPNYGQSPEVEYFKTPLVAKHTNGNMNGAKHTSRWKEDWEELELLGKGAYGSVVKARNKIDDRIYAVKKVRLKMHSDAKIFREVNALSRLSHRFIVRYYTTWVETSDRTEPVSTAASDAESDIETDDAHTSVPTSAALGSNVSFRLYDDLDELGNLSASRGSFPSIHFTRASTSSGEESDESDGDQVDSFFLGKGVTPDPVPQLQRTLYIQMEFVERQTLKEQVNDGLSEDEAWRLFKQIVESLVHMSSLGILHRDIKLTNIFIDGKGDVKVGDFGLATSSLAEVDPSDVSPSVVALRSDMTLDVGTTLYIAPEVQSRKRGPTNHTKADMYSLGIVFFEMNFSFTTMAERIRVIEDLRKPEIQFPAGWDPLRVRQREIITQLLNHDPVKRPTALELSQSPLIPHGLEDEYFRSALQMISKPDSQYHEAALSTLFSEPQNTVRCFLYDMDTEPPELGSLLSIITERLVLVFRLHGAIDMAPTLLMPVFDADEEKRQAVFLDRYGDIVTLPNNALVPFARLAAKAGYTRIKRYHIRDIYKPNAVAGHPKAQKAAVFDIISADLTTGLLASAAEIVAVANRILDSFPNLVENYDLFVSHSSIVDVITERIPQAHRTHVIDILYQPKIAPNQKRAQLLKRGLHKSLIDELEILSDFDEVDNLLYRLDKVSPSLVQQFRPFVEDIKTMISYATSAGATRALLFHPLMIGSHNSYFKDGILVEVARKSKRMDILAASGRYDGLVRRYISPTSISKAEPAGAYAFQISIDKIQTALSAHQSSSVKSLIKEERSFGFWTRKRCDVYIVSHQPGCLQDRLEVAAYLWKHNISCDLVYESGLQQAENYVDRCADEGILFILYPRPRAGRRDQSAFKVKSVLRGDETEVSRQDLVQWLRQEIAEQRRIDIATAQAPIFAEDYATNLPSNYKPIASQVLPVLPVTDTKKQRKQVKNIFEDRAFETAEEIRKIFLKPDGMPTIAVDVPASVFDLMIKSSAWLTDDELWKGMCGAFPTQQASYPHQIREAVLKKKGEGYKFVMLYAVREERMQLLHLQ